MWLIHQKTQKLRSLGLLQFNQKPGSEYTTVPPQYLVLFPFLPQNKPGIGGQGFYK